MERLVTRCSLQTHPNQDTFAEDHSDFVGAFRKSFSDITEHYKVEIPIAEIAYVWDYLHPAPTSQVEINEGSFEAREDSRNYDEF